MPRVRGWLLRVQGLPRAAKRAILVAADLCTIPMALWSAITLRLGTFDHGAHRSVWLYVVASLTTVPIFVRIGLYRAVIRYMAGRALLTICAGAAASIVLTFAADRLFFGRVVPDSAWIIFYLIAVLYVWGSRTLARYVLDLGARPRTRVLIYGAGEAGVSLAMALQKSREFQVVAFVDEDRGRQGTLMHGLEVFAPDMLEPVIVRHRVGRVLLAVPSMPRSRRSEIIQNLLGMEVHVQKVPDVADIVAGRAHVDDIRDVDISDLLGRDPVPPRPDLLAACITGKVVMVTGAGGSIGAELCRQIAKLSPRRLVLVELSELALYSIERELRATLAGLERAPELVPLLGNVNQKQRLREVMQTYGVQTVYHAAAYKHVPIVEQNVVQGVHNNVLATFYAAEAAAEASVETFVLVSTDKAVNPTNVMGATKRIAELVLQAMHQRGFSTKFCMVRFGNVLDSSGSVVPLFREQILRGGPVTVTHPEVVRYFMTIPEAAQLVIQAGSMAHGGEVFVLDMGQPIRIVDLARRMVALMGLSVRDPANPDGDIAIEFTGLRPGEKLFEELLLGDNVMRTDHPMILRAREYALPWKYVRTLLDDLIAAARNFDSREAVGLLSDAVAEYRSSPEIIDLVTTRRVELGLERDNVAELPARKGGSARPPQHSGVREPSPMSARTDRSSSNPPA